MSFYVEFNPPELNIDTGTQIARGGGSGGEISESLKEALLQMAEKVAYIDENGQDYYQYLYDALYPIATTYTISNVLTNVVNSNTSTVISGGESYAATLSCGPDYEITTVTITMGGNDVTGTAYAGGTISIPNVTGNIVITAVATQQQATLVSISAVFTQGQAVIYDTDTLDSLKQYLVVTANWDDSTTSTVASSDYTLSGTLSVGTSTITVSYSGKTTSFTVTVSQPSQGDIFGTFTNGYAMGKKMNSSQGVSSMAMYSVWNNSASARAAMTEPVANNNYTITVTDSAKYNLAVYGITDPTAQSTTYQYAITGKYFQGDSSAPSFAASGSTSASYVMISLKKMDGTSFTVEELANGAAEVFTYTSS